MLGLHVSAQQFSAIVVDAETEEALPGANVELHYISDTIITITDTEGRFSAPVSDNEIIAYISYLGYERLILSLMPDESIEYIFPLIIDESNIAVTPIIIANPFMGKDVSFNRKEFQVLPGAYEDPSRLLLKAPGFSTSNDQANYILYKGLPTQFINWSVNGAQVVNPNHLSNAGSLSDQSSINAGGVNMLSGQVIGTYDFAGAPYNLPFNDAIGGYSNVAFSDYDNTYLNFSLIGFEAGLGMEKDKFPGFQLNYRYSFVGLLSSMGVDFGNEKINYQDLFAKTVLLDNKDQKLEAFIAVGNNFNRHAAFEDRQEWEIFKDQQDIDFDGRLLLSGIKYDQKIGQFNLKAVLNYSSKNDERFASSGISFATSDLVNQQLLSSQVTLSKSLISSTFTVGVNTKYAVDNRENNLFGISQRFFEFNNTNLFPFANYQYQFGGIYTSAGLGLNYNSITQNISLDPSFVLKYSATDDHAIQFNYRKNSQLLSSINYSYQFNPQEVLGHHLDLTYNIDKSKYELFVSGYYHFMNNILVEQGSNYSQFTGVDHRFLDQYEFSGLGRVMGFAYGGQFRRFLIKDLSLSANMSIFRSEYTNSDGVWLDNTFGFDQVNNIMVNYKKDLSKSRDLVISLSYHNRGALKEFAIDEEQSLFAPFTFYDFNTIPEARVAPYTRMDFRIVYNLRKGNQRKFAKSLSLDILNLLNKENDAFLYFDQFQQSILLQKQLGMIPVLAYRIEF